MKLGRFWPDPWPYPHELGVGLRLTGYPRNEEEFLQFLYAESCNPVAARRILRELKEKGEKLTTVQPSFNFARLGDEFARLGVKMEVVPPYDKPINNTMIDGAALEMCVGKTPGSFGLTEDEVLEAHRRAAETGFLDPSTLGPYSWIADQKA